MGSYSKDIATIIGNDSSTGLTLATDLFYSRMPQDPQNVVVVYDNAGPGPILQYVKSRNDYDIATISIRCRNAKFDTGWSIMETLQSFLHGLSGVVQDGYLYTLVMAVNSPHQLHVDDNDRVVFNQIYRVHRRPN